VEKRRSSQGMDLGTWT